MTRLAKEVSEGGLYPRGYGVAWWDWTTNRGICYPIPLNYVLGPLRKLWWTLSAGPLRSMTGFERELYRARREGIDHGLAIEAAAHRRQETLAREAARQEGYREGWKAFGDSVLKDLDNRAAAARAEMTV